MGHPVYINNCWYPRKRSPIFHREEDGEVYDIVHMPNTSCPVDDNSNESFSPGDRESSRLRSAVDSSLPRSVYRLSIYI